MPELCQSEVSSPRRIQLKRTKGWRLRNVSPNAVLVSRPTRWGNPFKVGEIVPDDLMPYLAQWCRVVGRPDALVGMSKIRLLNVDDVVSLYDFWISQQPELMASLDELRGHDLACWCPIGEPCHADVLLEILSAD